MLKEDGAALCSMAAPLTLSKLTPHCLEVTRPKVSATMPVALTTHSRVLIEWLRKPQNFVTSSRPPWSHSGCGWCPLSTLSALCMTLRLLRLPESLIVRPPGGPVRRGEAGRVGVLGTVVKLR